MAKRGTRDARTGDAATRRRAQETPTSGRGKRDNEGAEEPPAKQLGAGRSVGERQPWEPVHLGKIKARRVSAGVFAIDLPPMPGLRRLPGTTALDRYGLDGIKAIVKYRSEPLANQLRDLSVGFALAAVQGDPAIVAAARILDGVWLALRRGKVEPLHDWERAVYNFTAKQDRAADEQAMKLPPRAYLDRPEAVRKLIKAAGENTDPARPVWRAARDLLEAVQVYFPDVNQRARLGRVKAEELLRPLVEEIRENVGRRQMPRKLAEAALSVLGVSKAEIKVWLGDE